MAATRSVPVTWVAPAAMAAGAGATDLLAVTTLGGVFASVVTGNLVVAGSGAGQAELGILTSPVVAISAYAAGVGLWLWLWRRRPYALPAQLLAELALLVVLAVGWMAVDGRPGRAAALGLLAVAALAMGGQSATALRLHAATTYLTGTLTGAVHDLVTRAPGQRLGAVRQLVAAFAGAAAAGVLLIHLRWSAPLLPVALLAIASLAALSVRPATAP